MFVLLNAHISGQARTFYFFFQFISFVCYCHLSDIYIYDWVVIYISSHLLQCYHHYLSFVDEKSYCYRSSNRSYENL